MADFNFPPGTKREDAIDELISDSDLKEVVLKQFQCRQSVAPLK